MKSQRQMQREAWEFDALIRQMESKRDFHYGILDELVEGNLQIVESSKNDKGQLVLIVEPVGDGRELPL